MNTMVTTLRISVLAAALVAAFPSLAQTAPDAGQILQQTKPPVEAPKTGPAIDIQVPAAAATEPGGAQVVVQAVSIGGNSVFSEAELLAVLGEFAGKSYDLAGLRSLAERIGAHYREAGYPFARAYLSQQTVADGKLRIDVVEGRYGRVQALGDTDLVTAATGFLAPLQSGDVIRSELLERTSLILDDQPGIKVTPIIRPGQEVGTGDIDVRVVRTPGISGDVGFDNHGNRYTGEYRVRANVQFDSPFGFGDQIVASALYSDENLWLGALGYSLPLGAGGLRGNVGYAHTYYDLGKDFSSLGANGTAKVATLGITYPIIRSQQKNLTVSATYQHKKLNDKQELAAADNNKSSDSLPISLQFDQRDGLWGGGITYGSLSYTSGNLRLDGALESADRTSGQNTRGRFDKWNLDIARVQVTPIAGMTAFARLSAQAAGKNLDSSEGFSLGGVNGVRAYPSGEGNGDEGWLAQLEVRYAIGPYTPYAFHDSGRAKLNANPGSLAVSPSPNHRSISGAGLGLRYQSGDWNMDAAIAWQTHGGDPQSDTARRDPRAWVMAGYKF